MLAIGNGLVIWNWRDGSLRNPAGGSVGHPVANDNRVSQVTLKFELVPSGDVPSTLPFVSK